MTALPLKRSSIALIRKNDQILAVSRKNNHHDLGLPGGKAEPGETFEEAVIREILEETGIRILRLQEVFIRRCGVFEVRTFQVGDWIGTPISLENSAVLWVPPERLLKNNCSFRDYNFALFKHLGIV